MSKPRKLVWIEWIDSQSLATEWKFEGESDKTEACICESVGWLLKDTKDVKVLAGSIGILRSGNYEYMPHIAIPTVAVRKIKKL